MKFYVFPLLILLALTQCSTKKDEEREAFINQLTTNTWFVPTATTPPTPSATPFVFNSDGSFTYDFTNIEGATMPFVHRIETVGHETFAYYTFDYNLAGEVLKLYMGVGIGINMPSQRPVIYKSELKVPPKTISPTATTEEKKIWYKDTYKESNILTHKGTPIAIR